MYISPNHPNPPRQPAAPRENGQRLATFNRGQGVEMRATLTEFEGHPYISLRLWEIDQVGAWWPTRRGCSVRISEAAELGAALTAVAEQLGDRAPHAPPSATPTSPRPRPWALGRFGSGKGDAFTPSA